jgi:hypothetical protein
MPAAPLAVRVVTRPLRGPVAAHLGLRLPRLSRGASTKRNAVGDLRGGRSPLPRALGIGGRAIARNDRDACMRLEPLGKGVRSTIGEERHGLAALQINQHGAIRLAFPQCEVIHTQDCRQRERRGRQPPEQPQQRVPAHPQVPLVGPEDNDTMAAVYRIAV